MKTKINYIWCSLFWVCTLLSAQDKKTEKATKAFNEYAYTTAIEKYETLVKKGYTDQQIYQHLGDAHYANARYGEAANWFSKLFELQNATIDADYMYKYAQSLKSKKEYKTSNDWMQKFITAKSADVRAKKIKENPDYLIQIEKQSGRYDIKNLSINSAASDFAPALNGDLLVFATARDSGNVTRNIHEWDKQPFLNLYIASPTSEDYGNVTKLGKNVNKKMHESSAVFTTDGSTVYFTRNNSKNGNFSRDEKGVSRLKIYSAKVSGGVWSEITELPFNSDNYSTAHPTLSPDEKTLYFASDMPGTLGQSDIFSVALNADGTVGTPVNMGNVINTEARETFPYITSENVLYFASDGHPGLGGLDIYATRIEVMDNSNIVNVGKPVNSEYDDFSIILDQETAKGFFASNREGGKGSDDIYAFTETKKIDLACNTRIHGVILDQDTGHPLPGTMVSIVNDAEQLIGETISVADGSFVLDSGCRDGNYKLVATKEGFKKGDKMFTLVRDNNTSGMEVKLERILKRATEGTELVKFLNLKPVYFDLGKEEIRPDASITLIKILEYMTIFPDMKVKVQSHTDVKASDGYNMRLSNRRSKSTVAYLVANGIDANRLFGEGFGESQIVNDCITIEGCTDERHQENRRSEFIVIK